MLLQILALFEKRETISLSELAWYFKIDRSALQGMLNELVNKGKIRRQHLECKSSCSDCSLCSFAGEEEYYQINN